MSGLVIVIGGAGGIGRATVRRLAPSHDVIAIDRREKPDDYETAFKTIDLSSEGAIAEAVRTALASKKPVKAVVFAAGTYFRLPIQSYRSDMFEKVMWDNFKYIFFLTRELLPTLVAQRSGHLIFVTSQAAAYGGLDPAYAAAKGAAQAFMKSIAREFGAFGIRCNAISPGPVETTMSEVMGPDRKRFYREMIPIKKLCTADEVASVIAFLIESAVDSLHGATIDIDGGLSRR